jgi:uncharacterized protein YkwD
MTDRRPARPDRRQRSAAVPRGRRRRRAPGTPLAALLAFVLGVSAAMWWAGRDDPPAFAIGAAATFDPAPFGGASRSAIPRAGRGEPRTGPAGASVPGRPASRDRAGGATMPPTVPPAAPARTLVPSRSPAPITPSRTASNPAPPNPTGSTPATSGAVADEVLQLTNAERAKVGCAPLHADSRLAAAAQGHSADMASRGYFAHVTPEGQTPWDRAKAAGYDSPSAENIAMGYRTPADVVAAWMKSDGHRQNILNCASHALGVGFDPRGYYWTQLFGYV